MKSKWTSVLALALCLLVVGGCLLLGPAASVQAAPSFGAESTQSSSSAQHEGLTDKLANSIGGFLGKYFPPPVIVFIVSLLPILELRGGMIVAALFSMPWAQAMVISIIANMIPVPFIILFIERILGFLKKHGPIKRFAGFLEEKGRKTGAQLMEKYPRRVQLGLLLFVAIPLPGTGAWTGSLAAALLGLSPKRSAPPIFLGILGASLIMSVFTYLIPGFFGI